MDGFCGTICELKEIAQWMNPQISSFGQQNEISWEVMKPQLSQFPMIPLLSNVPN
jgi:hypothetical protein